MKVLFIALIFQPVLLSGQIIHLIMVADEQDPQFGLTSIADEQRIEDMFSSVKTHLGYKLSTTYLNNQNFNAKSVKRGLNKIRSRHRDIIVFYYTGKGYYPANDPSPFPHLQLKNSAQEPLSLDDVTLIIDKKKEALGLVIADCRDTEPTGSPVAESITVSEDWIGKLVAQKLFLESCGVIEVASARKGQPVFTDFGGTASAFTVGFTRRYNNMQSSVSLNMVDNISLLSLLGAGFSFARFVDDRSTQIGITKTLPCRNTRRGVAMKFPRYANVMPYATLSENLSELQFLTNGSERKGFISELQNQFTKDAMVTLKTFKVGSNQPVSEKKMPVATYWQQQQKFNPDLVESVVLSNSITRTPDYTKITKMEVQEQVK